MEWGLASRFSGEQRYRLNAGMAPMSRIYPMSH
jgi:hypothetical protein